MNQTAENPQFPRPEYFSPDNLGFELTGILEGRQRPVTILDWQTKDVVRGFDRSKEAGVKLTSEGFATLHSVLYLTKIQLQEIVGPSSSRKTQESLSKLFEDLRITPSLRLARVVVGLRDSAPMPVSREVELDEAVEIALCSVTERERGIIEARYGLINWRMRKYDDISNEYGISRDRVIQIETKGLRKLRHPSRVRPLDKLIPLSENSFAYQVAELDILRGDLDELKGISIEELGEPNLAILRDHPAWGYPYVPVEGSMAELMETDAILFQDMPLMQIGQIKSSVADVIGGYRSGKYKQNTKNLAVSGFTAIQEPKMLVCQNNLIPDVDISSVILDCISTKPIEEVGFSIRVCHLLKRSGIKTVGEIIGESPEEVLLLRNVGIKSVVEITDTLKFYLIQAESQTRDKEEKEQYFLDKINNLPKVSAGIPLSSKQDQLVIRDFGANMVFSRRVLRLADRTDVSFVSVSVHGENIAKDEAVKFLTKIFGEPTERITNNQVLSSDYLTFISPVLQ